MSSERARARVRSLARARARAAAFCARGVLRARRSARAAFCARSVLRARRSARAALLRARRSAARSPVQRGARGARGVRAGRAQRARRARARGARGARATRVKTVQILGQNSAHSGPKRHQSAILAPKQCPRGAKTTPKRSRKGRFAGQALEHNYLCAGRALKTPSPP